MTRIKTLLPSRDFKKFGAHSFDWIVGLDEAGAGCLAGPLYVGAFAVPRTEYFLKLRRLPSPVNDSKKLNAAQRDKSFAYIRSLEGASAYVKEVAVSVIEEKNIYWARMETFLELVLELNEVFSARALFLVDGPRLHVSAARLECSEFCARWREISPRVFAFPKADGNYFAVAAASLIAKVNRDRMMGQLSELFPAYNWSQNKGYATPDHIARTTKHGLSHFHRPSFCKNISQGVLSVAPELLGDEGVDALPA